MLIRFRYLSGMNVMRNIILVFALIAVIPIAIFGLLYIFEVMSANRAIELLWKSEAAIGLLAVCSIAVSLLLSATNRHPPG